MRDDKDVNHREGEDAVGMGNLSRNQFRSRLPEIHRQAQDKPKECIMWMRIPGDDEPWRSLVLVPGWDAAIEVDERDLVALDSQGLIRFQRGTPNGGTIYVTDKGRGQ